MKIGKTVFIFDEDGDITKIILPAVFEMQMSSAEILQLSKVKDDPFATQGDDWLLVNHANAIIGGCYMRNRGPRHYFETKVSYISRNKETLQINRCELEHFILEKDLEDSR